jgi:DNA-binding NarL/FixJ family response regulator
MAVTRLPAPDPTSRGVIHGTRPKETNTARDGVEAVAVVEDTRPDVVLMDIRMPRLDGIEATRRITSQLPGCRGLVLTTFDLHDYVYAAVRAGASGFLPKDVPPADLVHAVSVVERGESMFSPALTKRLLERFATGAPVVGDGVPEPFAGLSERELDLVRLVAAGLSKLVRPGSSAP